MGKSLFVLLLLVCFITACENDNDPVIEDDNAVEFQGKNAVIRSGSLSSIRFKNLPGSVSLGEKTAEGEIRVEATSVLYQWLEAKQGSYA